MKRTGLKRTGPIERRIFVGRNKLDKSSKPSVRKFLFRSGKEKFKREWRMWNIKTWLNYRYDEKAKELGISAGIMADEGKEPTVGCMKCGRRTSLEADHIVPRSNFRGDNWDPTNGQMLCHDCNSEKGSQHGPEWDYRPEKYKAFQKEKASKEWKLDPMQTNPMKRWSLTDASASEDSPP